VQTVMPMHCSGLAAHARLSAEQPASYIQPAVGTVLHFGGDSA
jgi:7,8-dihydropterin-6-yl-methyl-4-(beta-D-ribofuranosyl)aminobenzene 5'-phosphate synthase